jgi:hypothetical protein
LTVKEAATLARMKYRTLYVLIEKGVVGERHGLCRRADGRHILIKAETFRRAFIEGSLV